MDWIAYAVLGYVFGSIPFGLILTHLAGLGDVRKIGSGNIGATNVLRTGNKAIAGLTLLCDVLKGYVPVILALRYGGMSADIAAGFGALAGHIFPVWLKFKGGKGVATGLGVLFAWSWSFGLAFVVTWIVIFTLTRISSASALAAMVVVSAVSVYAGVPPQLWPVSLLAVIIWITHRANIARLIKGEEPKSSFTKAP